ncbi:MAG: NfeD family protein [Oscillospiraceae bacterium]|nr:NfeD family protein [Oscillospiraceae bacterium]
MTAVWAIAIVAFLVLEGMTTGLVSIWFAVGSLAALLASLFGAPVWLQLVWFFIISIAAVIITRPLARKYLNSKTQATNADMYVGKECLVIETIDNVAGTGAVKVAGKVWTARSADGNVIPAGARAEGLRIEGVKLIVKPIHEQANVEG